MASSTLRQLHMYLALFLAPWALMYAASTFIMNHRPWFRGEPPAAPRWEAVSSQVYEGVFPEGASAARMASQILASLDMEGAHRADLSGGRLTILRYRAVSPARLTYELSSRRLTVERQLPDGPAQLERLHRRRGYGQPYRSDKAWAVSVDFFIAAMIFWALSGLWMWWEIHAARRAGWLSLAVGSGLFFFFFLAAL